MSSSKRWAGLAVLCASLLVVVMDMTILSLALPAIAADLRPGAVEQLWMVDVYALVLAGLLVTASALGDRWGRRRMLVAGFATFGAASVAVLLVDSPEGVIAVRALLGVGGAMIMPSTLSMVRALFTDPRQRATALGWWGATAAVGAALGPIIGGALLEAFSWHSAFLVNVPVMAVAMVAALLLLPESRSDRPGTLDPLATVLSVVGMVALVYAVKHTGEHGVDAEGVGTAVVAVAALVLFVRRCLAQPDPVLEVRLFRSRAFTAGTVTALCTSIASIAALLLLSQWLQLVRGWSPLESGLALLPMAVAGVVCSPLAPALAERIGARPVLAGGLAVGGLGFLLVFLLPEPLSYVGVAASLVLVGAGSGSLAVASAAIMSGAPESKAGSAAAIEESSYEIGGVLGVAVLGSLAAAVYRADLPARDLAAAGLDAEASGVVRDSLGGALEVADVAGPGLAAQATEAFTHSLAWAGLAGGLVMLAAAALVWWLAPRDLDVSAGH
ncbi:MFS transporter [Nocardioides lianchengensis]|uniref:MFS transporter, DHA2 family, multidrug resistance protein n=1 Tax=Nocardioides lianchengensis TaxID=1045774 RepID=A0A1G6MT35_9ACTN|nr:MFS transporter [Nocardioides lianchengensis]NYG10533.1 DHA2 family multidrug resistance protein-like MFS transporter [Nocardioides lianchengensis]SDC58699.1 MFS transporter, DHA2 family, multidrug resistance protein [Nocardioides lianchengensis]